MPMHFLTFAMKFSGGQMYAIIETGGKQYRVEKGDVIDVELIDAKAGEKVEFKNVLFVNNAGAVKDRQPQYHKICGPWRIDARG